MKKLLGSVAALTLVLSASLSAAEPASTPVSFENDWVNALALKDSAQRLKSLETLMVKVDAALKADPKNPELMIIKGNTHLEIANALGNMDSLSHLSDGRELMEAAMKIKPAAMDSMAEASLAAVMYFAPGWPLSYGDQDEAKEIFEKALKADPNSVELLVQYAGILKTEGKTERAARMLQKAKSNLNSDDMAGRDVLRTARAQLIHELLGK